MLRGSSKQIIHFRDDVSELSSPSNWGDRPGPLSLADHRLTTEGLQARRTAGEALLRARCQRQREAEVQACSLACRCLGSRVAKACVDVFRGGPVVNQRPSMVFTWSEVQSIILLPCESETRGPFLIAVTTLRLQAGELLLQAASARSRARWAVEMMTFILKERAPDDSGHARCNLCSTGRGGSALPTVLFMDMMRIVCEAARTQPSPEGIALLAEALEMLSLRQGFHGTVPSEPGQGYCYASAMHFPSAAMCRFREAARRAQEDLEEWCSWREVTKLLPVPKGLEEALWRTRVLPFLCPRDASLRDTELLGYPVAVESQLVSAAERCRRIVS
eukprot:TRINITY_DN26613_c0_g1_i1.p1 TRINITY_DN26613_c0_g1~~TRINITY_DN26613_c0_g1_i1.p1  ORF type:complete len:333 (-),score=48.56 TRINITY_DN26613_c0_g1_i1:2-1000(-)